METSKKIELTPFEKEMLKIEKEKLEFAKKKAAISISLAVAAENSRRAHYRRQNRSWWDW